MKALKRWTGVALINLSVVALLGFVLRYKIVFSLPLLDFKYVLHAHSHFAFGGWVTLSLLSLITYQMLPPKAAGSRKVSLLLWGVFINAAGMLLSFLWQGYAFFSILFSTLFIFVTYGYTYVFIKAIWHADVGTSVKVLSVAAVAYMALSSVGAFTLAYLLAVKSSNLYLYKDAVYTYLHLQYSGFFTLAVFALLFHLLKIENKRTRQFSRLLVASVLPSMFISYLWHFPNDLIRFIAIVGSALIVASTCSFFILLRSLRHFMNELMLTAKTLMMISLVAFVFKMVFQALTIVPSLGPLVFANRPVIIGFLHLVLLAFVTLYLLGHFIQSKLMPANGFARLAIGLFTAGVLLTELVLFAQGLGFIFMVSGALATWLLLAAASCLLIGAVMMVIARWQKGTMLKMSYNNPNEFKQFSQS